MSDIAIKIENLSKVYRIGAQKKPYGSLREEVYDFFSSRFRRMTGDSLLSDAENTIWALKDVSLEIKHGEVLGVIGRNGSGKSTLLKILSRITEPTKGRIELNGNVGSLLEVGTGFHPELTGRENIFLNGAILGMARDEIKNKFDEIVDFSGIEKLIDTPVKFYSSGMYVRLAFAVAAHLEPDILLVDEVLAVGDAAFQKKCLGKMEEVTRQGRTVLFVSHNMAAVQSLCVESLLLNAGAMIAKDKTAPIIEKYFSLNDLSGKQALRLRKDRQGDGKLRFSDICFTNPNSDKIEALQCGQDAEISISYEGNNNVLNNVSISIGIFTVTGNVMMVLNNQMAGVELTSLPIKGRISCLIERVPLSPGQYYINVYCEINGVIADWIQRAFDFTVEAGDFFGTGKLPPSTHGGMLVPQRWRFSREIC